MHEELTEHREDVVDLAELVDRLRATLVQSLVAGKQVTAQLEPVTLAGQRATALALVGVAAGRAGVADAKAPAPTLPGGYRHLVVIYEENHSFDNLYGGWGKVSGKKTKGLKQAKAGTTQIDQAGNHINCMLQNDANLITTTQTTPWLDGTIHPGRQTPVCSGTTPKGVAYNSHFASSSPFAINKYIKPTDATCATTPATY